ncbi:MAG: HU family DNA-binding protein [Bacteroides nordii]
MNERLYLQNFIDLLSEKYGMDKKDADKFVKEFFLLIEEALEQDRSVKIKGFGTFKLVDVESRESVKVNTGERFQIQGYTKVSFIPDGSLRDIINKPFSHFETVVLNEKTVLEDTPVMDSDDDGESAEEESVSQSVGRVNPEESIGEVESAEETVEEEKSSIEEKEQEVSAVENTSVATEGQDTVDEVATEEDTAVTEVVVPKVEEVKNEIIVGEKGVPDDIIMEKEAAPSVNQPSQLDKEKTTDPENSQSVAPKLSAEEIIARELAVSTVANELPVKRKSKPKQVKSEKSPVPYLIAIIVIVLLLCGGALLFIYYPDLFDSSDRIEKVKEMEKAVQPTSEPVILQDTIIRDTVAEVVPPVKEEIPVAVPVSKKEPETVKKDAGKSTTAKSVPFKPDSVSYIITGTKTTYTIKEGETLTRVALRFYGTKALWPYIVKHNPGVIKNPDNVPYGTTIKIPELVRK